ncbi:hypothetical protein RIF29_19594 [Crotalaria pallida]|uniref:Uncharacterized protein n=1 Tax=Crotalaria pallida TaxID=3830 RepID=A0AAN9I4A1_CROPI
MDFAGGSRRKRNRDIHPLDDSEGNENVCPKKLRLLKPLGVSTRPLGDITNSLGSSSAAENDITGNKVNESLTMFTPSMCQVKDDFALPAVKDIFNILGRGSHSQHILLTSVTQGVTFL